MQASPPICYYDCGARGKRKNTFAFATQRVLITHIAAGGKGFRAAAIHLFKPENKMVIIMPFRKRGISSSREKLENRINALTEVEPDFNLGDGLDLVTLSSFVQQIEQMRDTYNNTLGHADTMRDQLETLEREADDKAERLYAAVIARFGRDSTQYQQVGGVRKSKIDYNGNQPGTGDTPDPVVVTDESSTPSEDPNGSSPPNQNGTGGQ